MRGATSNTKASPGRQRRNDAALRHRLISAASQYSHGRVLGPLSIEENQQLHRPSRFDAKTFGGPVVRQRDESPQFVMYYYGRPNTDAFDGVLGLPTGCIGAAVSDDLFHWRRVEGNTPSGALLEPSNDESRFDCTHLGVWDANVVHDGDGNCAVRLWYFGGDTERLHLNNSKSPMGLRMRIGSAISQDGFSFEREAGFDSLKGAIFGPSQRDQISFDSLFTAWPQVVYHSDSEKQEFRLYYHAYDAFNAGLFIPGVAFSQDMKDWHSRQELLPRAPVGSFAENGFGTRHVIADPRPNKASGSYLMFVEGVDADGEHSIGIAESSDGITWDIDFERSPVLECPSNEVRTDRWDGLSIGCPEPFVLDKTVYLFYIGFCFNPTTASIGLAMAPLDDLSCFKRITGH